MKDTMEEKNSETICLVSPSLIIVGIECALMIVADFSKPVNIMCFLETTLSIQEVILGNIDS